MSETRPVDSPPPPERFIGRYRVVRSIGTGGMAEVWLCRRSSIGGFEKSVAVKCILPHLAKDQAFVRMFLDEARVAAGLNHPNIVQVYDVDTQDGVPYIAMEYVRGPSLQTLLLRAREAGLVGLGIPVSVRLISDVAEALQYAHNASDADGVPLGLVHRDVSPHNILVSREGTAKLVDFGVAKSRGRMTSTRVGTIKGKSTHMAPEQARAQETDHRVDVYALGVCLYEATTGRLPFVAENDVERMMQVVGGEFPRPSELVPGYPPRLEEIVLSAMARDPANRTPNALALQEALEQFSAETHTKVGHSGVATTLADLIRLEDIPGGSGPTTPSSPRFVGGSATYQAIVPAPSSSEMEALAVSEESQPPAAGQAPPPTGSGVTSGPSSLAAAPGGASPAGSDGWPAASRAGSAADVAGLSAPAAAAPTSPGTGPHAPAARDGAPRARRRWAWTIVGLLCVIAGSGLGFLAFRHRGSGSPNAPAHDARDEGVRAAIEVATRLVETRAYITAKETLQRAQGQPAADGALNAKVALLLAQVETAMTLELAAARVTDKDYDGALDLARSVLERDRDNAQATRLLLEVEGLKAAATAPGPPLGEAAPVPSETAATPAAPPLGEAGPVPSEAAPRPRAPKPPPKAPAGRAASPAPKPPTTGFDPDSLLPSNPDSLLPPGRQ